MNGNTKGIALDQYGRIVKVLLGMGVGLLVVVLVIVYTKRQ
jgi:hypothetical protein